ncbi:MAG: SMC-Scp complex subunit ScpB [bacterium]|nr:SMC-Scp complex subunit ScpB [bacterium]
MNLESKIEAILFFKNEPVSIAELGKWLGEKPDAVKKALSNLEGSYKNRGIVLISLGESVSLGTHPNTCEIIESLQKEELSRELGRAGLETLSVILYKGPISRREIDHIRGVNSGFILRSLLIRGLIERAEGVSGDRSYSYKATIKLLEYLGVTRLKDLPDYENAFKSIEGFIKTTPAAQNE